MSEFAHQWQRRRRELALGVAAAMPGAVDELHVAASLESRGITDQMARDRYGYRDVFDLARALFRDIATRAVPPRASVSRPKSRALWILAHGPLYALPSAAYPAAFTMLGAEAMVRGMVFATALGWVWGMGMSAVAYQLRGQCRERAAGKALRWLGAAGIGAALLGAVLLALAGPGGTGLVAFVVGQMTFQLTSGVLVFYRRELLLVALMAPTFIVGVTHIVTGYAPALVGPALGAAGLSAVLIAGAAWFTAVRQAARAEADPPGSVAWHRSARGAAPSVCYAAMGALFLLFTDSRYVVGQFDLAIAVAPLVLGMGTVEWRAGRFTERAADSLRHKASPAEFRRATLRLAVHELALCLLVLAVLAAVLLGVLYGLGMLTYGGVLLVEAHVILGGAYFLGFVLARHEQFPALLAAMAATVTADVVAVTLFADDLGPGGPITIFLVSTSALLVLLLARLCTTAGRIYHYR